MQSTKESRIPNTKAAAAFIAPVYILIFIALLILSVALLFNEITFQFFICSSLVILAIDAIFTGFVFIGSALLELATNIKTKSP